MLGLKSMSINRQHDNSFYIILNQKDYPYLVPLDLPMIRIGNTETDGGYVIPQLLLDSVDGVLSFGIGDDWTFDNHFKQLRSDCEIHAYDSTVEFDLFTQEQLESYNNTYQGSAKHYKENIGKKFIRSEFTEFSTAFERLNKTNVFVKMDIEGGEYTLTKDILDHKDSIAGLVIEYHGAASTSRHCFLEELPIITEHYSVVHIHANNSGPVVNGFPDYLELTFIRKDLTDNASVKYNTYIVGVDKPCSLFLDDYEIEFHND